MMSGKGKVGEGVGCTVVGPRYQNTAKSTKGFLKHIILKGRDGGGGLTQMSKRG